jgi:hypothetical protein
MMRQKELVQAQCKQLAPGVTRRFFTLREPHDVNLISLQQPSALLEAEDGGLIGFHDNLTGAIQQAWRRAQERSNTGALLEPHRLGRFARYKKAF